MNQEFRRRLVKQIPVFLQTWNIFVLEYSKYTLTLQRVERILSLFRFPTFTFPQFLAGMNSSVITHEPGLHGEKHYLVLHNIELSADWGYKMTSKHDPNSEPTLRLDKVTLLIVSVERNIRISVNIWSVFCQIMTLKFPRIISSIWRFPAPLHSAGSSVWPGRGTGIKCGLSS